MDDGEHRKAMGSRLRAARLVAGFPTIQEAADRLGVPATTLRAVEAGRRPINIWILARMFEVFGIDEGAVVSGTAFSDKERKLLRLAEVLRRPELSDLTPETKRRLSFGLVKLRRKAGLASAAAAAAHHGWRRSSYLAYEGHSATMSVDRLAFFAMAFTDDIPGFFFPEDRRAETELAAAAQGHPGVEYPTWLPAQPPELPLSMPILQISFNRLQLSSETLSVPRRLLNYETEGRLFAMQLDPERWNALALCDYHFIHSKEACWVFAHGRARRVDPAGPFERSDPVGTRGDRPVLLGSVIGKLGTDRW